MARTKKSQSAESVNISSETKTEQKENLNLEDLLKLVNSLQSQLTALSTPKVAEVIPVSEYEEDDDIDQIEINPQSYITVVSLCWTYMTLSTKGRGKGKLFNFPEFSTKKRIMYSDLVEILENHPNFLEQGLFYIADKRVIRRHGLNEIYSKILDKSKIETILSGVDNSEIISIFKSANPAQQGTIVQLLIDKRLAGGEIDLNLWDKLSRASNINMQSKYENAKEYLDYLNSQKEEDK